MKNTILALCLTTVSGTICANNLDGNYHADMSQYAGSTKDFVEMVDLNMSLSINGSKGALRVSMHIPQTNIKPVITNFSVSQFKGNYKLTNEAGSMLVKNIENGTIEITCLENCEANKITFPKKWMRN